MALFAAVFRTLVNLLNAQFGHIDTSPNAPHEEALREGERPEIDVPVFSGKMNFAAEERRTEIVLRLALSEEAITAGSLIQAQEWARKAKTEIPRIFPKFEKRIRIAITEMKSSGDMEILEIFIIDPKSSHT